MTTGDDLPEPRIAEARHWIDTHPNDVPEDVRKFVAASQTKVEARIHELQDAREAAQRRATMLHRVLVGTAIIAVVAIVLAVVAVDKSVRASRPSGRPPCKSTHEPPNSTAKPNSVFAARARHTLASAATIRPFGCGTSPTQPTRPWAGP